MQVNNNGVSSLISQVQEKQNNLFEKLASGKKVNNATDGAAAQQIIDRLTSEVEGSRQAINNVYDGISLAQVAEGGLGSINPRRTLKFSSTHKFQLQKQPQNNNPTSQEKKKTKDEDIQPFLRSQQRQILRPRFR